MNIIELARQAGFITDLGCRETASDELLTRFAALVRNATLDEADKVIEEIADEYGDEEVSATWIAAAIRQLKETK